MFGFTKMMFIVLLSPCTTSRLAESLASTSEGRIKCSSTWMVWVQMRIEWKVT